jgi:hypothetical protein
MIEVPGHNGIKMKIELAVWMGKEEHDRLPCIKNKYIVTYPFVN